MSKTNAGIPLNFGLTHGFQNENSFSLLTNAMPDNCTFQFSRPIEMQTLKDLNEFTSINRETLPLGFTVLVKDIDNNKKGLQRMQYYWNGIEWLKLGNPNVSEYLNIFSTSYISVEPGNGYWDRQFFMRIQAKNIQSNINVISLLNNRLAVTNTDIISYIGLNGNYSLETNGSLNLLTTLLNMNIKSGMNLLMKKLCNKYQTAGRSFKNLNDYIFESVIKILRETSMDYTGLCIEYETLDLSMYINFIGACFASIKNIISNNANDTTLLDPNNYLHMIDENVYNIITKPYTYIEANSNTNTILNTSKVENIQSFFVKLLGVINRVLHYNENTGLQSLFYKEVISTIEYFKESNPVLFKYSVGANKFYADLIEGIAGIVTLALFFSVMSNGVKLTKSTLYLHFLFPDLYKQIN